MANEVISRIRETIIREELIESGDIIFLALSGGPDSVCLFHALLQLSKEMEFSLRAVHVNHGLRKQAAEEDCDYVKTLCRDNGVPLDAFEIDVQKIASEKGIAFEEAGRQVRYNCFDEVALRTELEEGIPSGKIKIATAHNKNDQVETLLMRIIRGTGSSGLAGIPIKRKDGEGFEIIRPLLEVDRQSIEDYLTSANIEPQIDKTNADTKYLRNRIRHKLIPVLTEEFGDASFDSIFRLSVIAAEEKSYFEAVVSETIENNCEFLESNIHSEGDSAVISLELMQGVHPAIRHKLITGIFSELGLDQDIASVHLAYADDLIFKGETGKRIDFPKGYSLEVRYEDLVFRAPVTIEAFDNVSGKNILGEKVEDETEDETSETITVEFDADEIEASGQSPVWRTRLPGDRIKPEGMSGSKKLQDLFVDMKIPRDVRDKYLILAIGSNVLWVPGIRKSRDFAVTENTKRAIKFTDRQNLHKI